MIDPAGTGKTIVPTAIVGLNIQPNGIPNIALRANAQCAGILSRIFIPAAINTTPDIAQHAIAFSIIIFFAER